MKKSLLALAILGAFASVASAQSSVTVYGVVDTGFTSIDNGGKDGSGKGTINGISSGNDAASRIGFKGTEDLGNGLKAEFVLENGINTDDGSAANADQAFSRLAFVGLKGGFGTVRLGKQDTQLKAMLSEIDPFGAAGIANSVNYVTAGGIDQRNPNQVAWLSNNYAGFSGGIAYQFGEKDTGTGDNSQYSARLGYKNGPLNVQFGYQNKNNTTATFDGDQDIASLGATYDFGVVKLHGLYAEKDTDGKFVSATAADIKIRSALIGVTVPMGASKIRAEYIRNDNRDVDDADNNVWAVSYTYAMSKRTGLYATYLRTSNDSKSQLGVGGTTKGTLDESSSGLAVGVTHKF